MALKKSFTLPEGYTADYIRFDRINQFSRTERKATFIFALFKDQATAAVDGALPIRPEAVRLKVERDKFDQYFSNGVLAEADIVAQAYVAAKVESVDMWLGSGALLTDAEDV